MDLTLQAMQSPGRNTTREAFDEYARGLYASLPPAVAARSMIAGGALRAFYDQTEVKDYDLYFQSKADMDAVDAAFAAGGYELIFRCPLGLLVTYRDAYGMKYQVIGLAFFNSPAEVIHTFDITASQFAVRQHPSGEIEVAEGFFAVEHALQKKLAIHALPYPAASLKRVGKYIEKGYSGDADFWRNLARQFSLMMQRPASSNAPDWRLYVD